MISVGDDEDQVYINVPTIRPYEYSIGYSFRTPLPDLGNLLTKTTEEKEDSSETEEQPPSVGGPEVAFNASIHGALKSPRQNVKFVYEDGTEESRSVGVPYCPSLQRTIVKRYTAFFATNCGCEKYLAGRKHHAYRWQCWVEKRYPAKILSFLAQWGDAGMHRAASPVPIFTDFFHEVCGAISRDETDQFLPPEQFPEVATSMSAHHRDISVEGTRRKQAHILLLVQWVSKLAVATSRDAIAHRSAWGGSGSGVISSCPREPV
jgi:hypothetical protein